MYEPQEPASEPRLDSGLLIVRVVVGIFSIYHGLQQIVHLADFTLTVEQLGVPLPALAAWLAVAG